jgi:hypothetical protein
VGGFDYCSPKAYNAPAPDTLYRNAGDGSFSDVSVQAGLRAAFGNGLGVVCLDFDADGWSDFFVANDATMNQLWINQGDGTFVDRSMRAGCAADQDGLVKAGMGVSAADFDDDGDEDLLIVNLIGETDSFYTNEAGQVFRSATARAGLTVASRAFTRFGCGLVDLDNDGGLDLYLANGGVTRNPSPDDPRDPYAQLNLLFRLGEGRRFTEVFPRGGTAQPLIATSRAAIFGDVDGDGGIDVLVINRDAPAHLLMNRATRGHWAAFTVVDEHGRPALGARVLVRSGTRTWHRTVRSAYSYCAANDPRVHIGLAGARQVDGVEVTWVGGVRESFGPLEADRDHELVRGCGRSP